MEYNEKKHTIKIFDKEEKISTVARKLASLSGKQVYDFFSNRQVGLPRTINCLALISILNERLKTLTASEVTKDQAVRLQSYDKFSEVELYDLFVSLCPTKESYKQYRINLFTIILINAANLKLTAGEINYLINVQKSPIEKVDIYSQYVTSCSYEMVNTFDGQDIERLIDGFNKSAVISDIINLASKYGITLNQKYTKDELVAEVKDYLKLKDAYTLDLEAEIDAATVSDLNLFCSKRNIPLASSMNKDNLIKYFFFILDHAEIPTTEVTTLDIPKEFEPLEFKVDLSAYKGFKNEVTDPTKQIIWYDGKEEQEGADEVVVVNANPKEALIEEAPTQEEAEEVQEEVQEETEEVVEEAQEEYIEEVAEDEEEVTEEYVDDESEEVMYVDEDGNPVDPEDVEAIIEDEEEPQEETEEVEEVVEEAQEEAIEEPAEEAPVAVAQEEIEEDKEEVDEQQELKKKIADAQKKEKLALSFGNVEESDLYGDEKLYKALKPPVKLIVSIIGCLLVAAAVIILIIAYMPR